MNLNSRPTTIHHYLDQNQRSLWIEGEGEGGLGNLYTIVADGVEGLHEVAAHVVGAGGDPPDELLRAPGDASIHPQRPLHLILLSPLLTSTK